MITKSIEEIILELKNSLFIIDELMQDEETYNENLNVLYDYMKQGFEIDELRKCPIHFKFVDASIEEGGMIHTLEVRHFITNLMMWEPIMYIGGAKTMDESYIVDAKNITAKVIKNYIDEKIITSKNTKMISNSKKNSLIHDMIFKLSNISYDFNIIFGLGIDYESFIEVAERNPRFNEIIRTKFPENMQPNDIEHELNGLEKELVEILSVEDNKLKPILLSGTGIKHKQLCEASVNGGFKPDLDGNTIPLPINSNFIVGGLGNVVNYFIDALGGRKALIMNKTEMGNSGHFARMVMLLVSDLKISHDEEQCNSINPIMLEVSTEQHLKRLVGRHYRKLGQRQYKIMNGKEKDLIGETILLKSPMTCTCKTGICKACYGELYDTNKDLNSIGGYAGTVVTEPVSQNILSSKHLLTTNSESIEIEGDDLNMLSIFGNEISLNPDIDDIDYKNYTLLIERDDYEVFDKYDDKNDFNTYVSKFYIRDKKTKTTYTIKESGGKKLYITPEFSELIKFKRSKFEKSLNDIEDIRLFMVEISNNELTKPLYDIMELVNSKEHLGIDNIDDMLQKFLDLVIVSSIDASSVHLELILRCLIRCEEDILEIPDFSNYAPKYKIMTIASALEKNPSVNISMSFQYLKRQLTDPLTFKKKGESYIDAFYE